MKTINLLFAIAAIATLSLGIGTSNANAQVCFSAATNFALGGYSPSSITKADFNGDNKTDLAVTNSGPGSVSVLLGNGNGAFGTATDFTVGSSPKSITTSDFNGDHKADLAIANNMSNNVSILIGNGTGGFDTAVNYTVGNNPSSVISADFNGDSIADLAVSYGGASNVSILIGNGTGSFGAPVNFAIVSQSSSVCSADFNGDGKADLAVANYNSGVSILLGNGAGSFGTATSFTAGSNPYYIISADINGDNKVDLVTVNYGSNNVSLLLGNGAGSFSAPTNFATGSYSNSAISTDFDGDSKLDLAVTNGSNVVSVLRNNGSGGFDAAINFTVGDNPSSVISSDFNADGKPDLAVTNNMSSNVSALLNCSLLVPPICMVTVDNTSTENIIVWEKTPNTTIDSFRIYREVASVYQLVGSVANSDLSEFTDNTNGINPKIASYKYKMTMLDTSGNESSLSALHQTIHLQLSAAIPQGVNLIWNDYLGFTFSQYRILRDDLGTNNWHVIDSLSFGQTTYTDLAQLPNARYLVEVAKPVACTPSMKRSISYNSVQSNTSSFTTGISQMTNDQISIAIYPNPTSGLFTILLPAGTAEIMVTDLLGQQIIKTPATQQTMSLQLNENGVYIVYVSTKQGTAARKLIVNR